MRSLLEPHRPLGHVEAERVWNPLLIAVAIPRYVSCGFRRKRINEWLLASVGLRDGGRVGETDGEERGSWSNAPLCEPRPVFPVRPK